MLGENAFSGQILIPWGQRVLTWFGLKAFPISLPSNLDYVDIRELRILPRNGALYAEFVYKTKVIKADVIWIKR